MQRMHGGSNVWPQIKMQDKVQERRPAERRRGDLPPIRETCDTAKITLALREQWKVSPIGRIYWWDQGGKMGEDSTHCSRFWRRGVNGPLSLTELQLKTEHGPQPTTKVSFLLEQLARTPQGCGPWNVTGLVGVWHHKGKTFRLCILAHKNIKYGFFRQLSDQEVATGTWCRC